MWTIAIYRSIWVSAVLQNIATQLWRILYHYFRSWPYYDYITLHHLYHQGHTHQQSTIINHCIWVHFYFCWAQIISAFSICASHVRSGFVCRWQLSSVVIGSHLYLTGTSSFNWSARLLYSQHNCNFPRQQITSQHVELGQVYGMHDRTMQALSIYSTRACFGT